MTLLPRAAIGLIAVALAATASAKLPAPSDEGKAKAAEAAARTAWTNKVAEYRLCQVQDQVAATWRGSAQQAGKAVAPVVPTPACVNPGPFAYVPPLEAAGAHSPPATAAQPPNSATPQAAQPPSEKQSKP